MLNGYDLWYGKFEEDIVAYCMPLIKKHYTVGTKSDSNYIAKNNM